MLPCPATDWDGVLLTFCPGWPQTVILHTWLLVVFTKNTNLIFIPHLLLKWSFYMPAFVDVLRVKQPLFYFTNSSKINYYGHVHNRVKILLYTLESLLWNYSNVYTNRWLQSQCVTVRNRLCIYAEYREDVCACNLKILYTNTFSLLAEKTKAHRN
jgi:hypothetical protein